MFKAENRIWWYLLGVILMMVLMVVFTQDYLLPVLKGERRILEIRPYFYSQAPSFTINKDADYKAKFITSDGNFTVDLFERRAPVNVNNFIFLTNESYYDGTKIHRIIPDFLIQGGDRNSMDDNPDNDGRGGPGYFMNDEVNWDSLDFSQAKRDELSAKGYSSTAGLESYPLTSYVLAIASSQPNTNGSQFFIVTADSSDSRLAQLNGYFTVIGRVTSGLDVVTKIANSKLVDATVANPRPAEDVVVTDIQILQ